MSRLPLLPAETQLVNALRVPVLMDCTRARQKLAWEPRFDALDTLSQTIFAARDMCLLSWKLIAPPREEL